MNRLEIFPFCLIILIEIAVQNSEPVQRYRSIGIEFVGIVLCEFFVEPKRLRVFLFRPAILAAVTVQVGNRR